MDGNSNAEGGAHERKSLRRPQFAEGQDDILNMLPIRAAPVTPERGTQLTPPAPAAGPAPVEPTEFPCPAGCGRTFTHAPAAANHGKACGRPPAPAPWPDPSDLIPPVLTAAVPPASIADYVTAATPIAAPAPPPPAPVPTMVPEPAALPSPEQPPPAGV